MPVRNCLAITSAQRDMLFAHALQEAPNECCGLLIGRHCRVEQVVAMQSDMPSPDSYYMNPEQQVAVFTEMKEWGGELLGIYHSHPIGPAVPSAADLHLAFHPEVAYFIISLADRTTPELHAFRIAERTFEGIVFEVTA